MLTALPILDKDHDFIWLVKSTGHRTIQAKGQHRLLQKNYVFSTKTDVVSTYPQHPPIMSHDFLNTLSREVMWQIKSLISPIPQGF